MDGIGWESPNGDVVGSSPVGALLNNRLEAALSTRSTVLSPEDADGAKGIFGTIVRGAFKVIEAGVRVSLHLVDRNSGQSAEKSHIVAVFIAQHRVRVICAEGPP